MNHINLVIKRFISSSNIQYAGKAWRQKHGLPKLQTGLSSIIDIPDYSFLDGRPVPLSIGQRKRNDTQERLCREIVDGLNYIKQGKQEVENEKRRVLNEKLNSSANRLIEKNFTTPSATNSNNSNNKINNKRRRK